MADFENEHMFSSSTSSFSEIREDLAAAAAKQVKPLCACVRKR